MALRRSGLYCGVISPVLWLALIAVAGALTPDFSHLTNYISELGERGSPTEALVRYGAFGVTGFLYVCFAGALLATFRQGWLQRMAALLIAVDGIGRIGAGVFPCDPGCVQISVGLDLHRLFATIGFCSGILAAVLWGALFRGMPFLRALSSISVASGAVAGASLLLMSWAGAPAWPAGLFEHVATVVLSLWLLVFAARVVSAEKATARGPDHLRMAPPRRSTEA